MKRIIPFLLLAVALGACRDEGPTDLSDTPLFAKPDKCEPWPECKDGDGGQYSAIDLTLCKRCGGVAHDISEPDGGGVLHVVGWMDEPMGWPRIPVVWIGTMGALAEAEPVILSTLYQGPGSGSPGFAVGINDDATAIVGRTTAWEQPTLPVIWLVDGSGGWTQEGNVLLLLTGYGEGNARDVNNGGTVVGRLSGATDTVAVMWTSWELAPAPLPRPGGAFSAALGLNNDGDAVGRIWNASGAEEAVLWTAEGSYCNLNPAGYESVAVRVDDRNASMVLVAGVVATVEQPAVWTVDVTTCALSAPTPALIDGAGWANDVRAVGASWEAVGVDETGRDDRPIVWFDAGTSSELLHGKLGNAYVISSAGHIVGYRELRGSIVPAVWSTQ